MFRVVFFGLKLSMDLSTFIIGSVATLGTVSAGSYAMGRKRK